LMSLNIFLVAGLILYASSVVHISGCSLSLSISVNPRIEAVSIFSISIIFFFEKILRCEAAPLISAMGIFSSGCISSSSWPFSLAISLTAVVFPVPVGPCSSTACPRRQEASHRRKSFRAFAFPVISFIAVGAYFVRSMPV
jgi:hypothetical protein